MENIKNLTAEELVELAHTWQEANKKERGLIMMAGEEFGERLANTQCVCGGGKVILTMLAEFIGKNPELIKSATLCSLMKRISDKVNESDN